MPESVPEAGVGAANATSPNVSASKVESCMFDNCWRGKGNILTRDSSGELSDVDNLTGIFN